MKRQQRKIKNFQFVEIPSSHYSVNKYMKLYNC